MPDRFVSRPDNTVGYAFVSDDGFPFVDTVASTERAAMVNALALLFGAIPTVAWSDARIRAEFQSHAHISGGAISPVCVERLIVEDDKSEVPDG